MRIRRSNGNSSESGRNATAAMIDVVFLLLIFFMLTFKILAPEGELRLQMADRKESLVPPAAGPRPIEIRVRLVANADGSLNRLQLGRRILGNDRRAFERLNDAVLKLTGRRLALPNEFKIEIDSDYNLHHEYVVHAVSACTGQIDPQTGDVIHSGAQITFTPTERPGI